MNSFQNLVEVMSRLGVGAATAILVISGVLSPSAGCAQDQQRTFPEPPATTYSPVGFQVSINGTRETREGAAVSPDFFTAAHVRPLLGRLFIDGDNSVTGPSVVVISHELWQQRLGGSPQVIGSRLELNDHAVVVVGVAERGFAFPEHAVLWVPKGK